VNQVKAVIIFGEFGSKGYKSETSYKKSELPVYTWCEFLALGKEVANLSLIKRIYE
jgi:hypothetical protein